MSELEPTRTYSNPTATEVLRRMLDERGVEWMPVAWNPKRETFYHAANGVGFCADEYTDGVKIYTDATITPAQAIAATLGPKVTGNTSDGYRTFNELYHHRAVLFSVIVRDHRELAWKSMRHHDGTMYDGMFIVGIETPEGQATYHYDIDPYWDMFNCKELDQAPEWDGHTPSEAIERIATLGSCNCPNNCTNSERTGTWVSPTWERWHKSLRHDEIKSIGDAVEQLMYEVIEFGGDMGPNGNTYNGIDEGDVLTAGYINEWVERFENMLGAGTCHMVLREDIRGHAYQDIYECSECGEEVVRETYMGESEPPNYCPECGRRCVG